MRRRDERWNHEWCRLSERRVPLGRNLPICEYRRDFCRRHSSCSNGGSGISPGARQRRGVEKLSRLPAFLAAKPNGSKHTNLFRLFQPDLAVRILFDLGVSFTRKGVRQWISVLGALLKSAWLVWLLFAVLTALYILLPSFSTLRESLFDRVSSTLWLLGGLTAGLAAVLISKLKLLPRKGFGLCSGMTQNGSGHPALTAWFHEYINDL